jgi:hypothetical protein
MSLIINKKFLVCSEHSDELISLLRNRRVPYSLAPFSKEDADFKIITSFSAIEVFLIGCNFRPPPKKYRFFLTEETTSINDPEVLVVNSPLKIFNFLLGLMESREIDLIYGASISATHPCTAWTKLVGPKIGKKLDTNPFGYLKALKEESEIKFSSVTGVELDQVKFLKSILFDLSSCILLSF